MSGAVRRPSARHGVAVLAVTGAMVAGAGIGTLVATDGSGAGQGAQPSPVANVDRPGPTVEAVAPVESVGAEVDSVETAGPTEEPVEPRRLRVRATGGAGTLELQIAAAVRPIAAVLVIALPDSTRVVRSFRLSHRQTHVTVPDLPSGEVRWRVAVVEGAVERMGVTIVQAPPPEAPLQPVDPPVGEQQAGRDQPAPAGSPDGPIGINDQPSGPRP